jgi:hypothetical protein
VAKKGKRIFLDETKISRQEKDLVPSGKCKLFGMEGI